MKQGESTQINRDPFGRVDIVRRTVTAETLFELEDFSCFWCGGKGRRVNSGRRLFQYGVWEDGIHTKPYFNDSYFCSKQCYDVSSTD